MINALKRLYRRLIGRRVPVHEMRDEMGFHLEMETADLMREGLSRDEAERRAKLSFGGADRHEEAALDNRRVRPVETMMRDVRFALRTLVRTPMFTAVAVLTLAVGIGATTSVFTVVNGVLLRPLPYAQPERLVLVWTAGENVGPEVANLPTSAGNYLDMRDRVRSLEVAAFRSRSLTLSDEGGTERIDGAAVASSLFGILGVRPILGRSFNTEDELEGAGKVVVIGYDVWQTRFGGARDVIGKSVGVGGEKYSVIGVMPRGFSFPRGAELPTPLGFPERAQVWLPLVFDAQTAANRGTQNLSVLARLRDGFSMEGAQSDLAATASAMAPQFPPFAAGGTLRAVSMHEQASERVKSPLLILLGVAAFVLLIACANVANLILVRGLARERELAIRTALGAGTRRIALQVITENVVLALLAAVAGTGLAVLGTKLMLKMVPGHMPRADDVALDTNVLGATLLIALVAGVLFGLATLVYIDRNQLSSSLQGVGGRATSSLRQGRMRRALIGVEIALALVLLVGASLLTISFVRVQQTSPGFNPDNVLAGALLVPFGPGFNPDRDGPRWTSTFTQVLERVRALPGVVAAGSTSALPLSGGIETTRFEIDGRTPKADGSGPSAEYAIATPDYFRAMGIEMLKGRAFTDQDRAGAPSVVVINQALADKYFPGEDPVGKRLASGLMSRESREIVGVARSVLQAGLDAKSEPELYFPMLQVPYPFQSIIARTKGNPQDLQKSFRRILRDVDPSLAWGDVRPMQEVLSTSLASRRFSMMLVSVFAGAALLLTVVGLYGAISFAVSQRTREIGVRMALGARPGNVMRLVMRDGIAPTVFGVIAGSLGAWYLTRLIAAQLYGVAHTDVRIYLVAIILLTLVAAAATVIPAMRATRVQPVSALKTD